MAVQESRRLKLSSWSWISQFGTGNCVSYARTRRGLVIPEYGAQLYSWKIERPQGCTSLYGSVVSASITITAWMKWVTITLEMNETPPSHPTHYVRSDHDPHASRATLMPNFAGFSQPTESRSGVLCVLCAVSQVRNPRGNEMAVSHYCGVICVMPTEPDKGKFRRIGYALLGSGWFGRECWDPVIRENVWKPSTATGAFQRTIELV